jgi:hypothetical protein
VFARAEPFKAPFFTTDGKDLSYPTFKLWFKNVGQATAQNEIFTETFFVKTLNTQLSEQEEEAAFNILRNNTNPSIVRNDIQPGNVGYFFSGVGLTDEIWTSFTDHSGPPKFLYVMSILTYGSENLDSQDKIVTETCVIYMNNDGFNDWFNCRSGHNGIAKVK